MSQCVLAIDDSPDVHRLLDVRLRPEGLVLHHALDAELGLKMAHDIRPDLILLDVDLPLFTGFEVCQKLKEDPITAQIPVIFLTGATEVYALTRHEPFVVPLYALIAAPASGFVIGALAGLYPAAKAARLSPTEALRTT